MPRTRLSNAVFVLIDEVIRVNGRLKNIFATEIASTGLTSMAYAVFTAIAEAQRPPTVPQIGRSLGHPRQVVQKAVTELIGQGLVERLPNPDHKRAPLLQPTAAGREFKRESDSLVLREASQLLKFVDEDSCRRAAQDLHEIRSRIEAYLRHRDA